MSKPESVDPGAESIPVVRKPDGGLEPVTDSLNDDKVAALIKLAGRTEELGAALDKIRKFVLSRCLPGDFVIFREMDKETGQPKEGYLELVGPGADRIASALGISFVDWKDWKESWEDKHGHAYTWWYECTVLFGGRTIERVQGRASSRNMFFGYAYGVWKPLEDVNESDIRTAARHNTMKEGVKLSMGLRRIPESAAAELGLDISKCKPIDFGKVTATNKAFNAAAKSEDGGIRDFLTGCEKGKSGGRGAKAWQLMKAKLKSGISASFFSPDRNNPKLPELVESLVGQEVIVYIEKDGKYTNLKNIKAAPPKTEEPAKPAEEAKPKDNPAPQGAGPSEDPNDY